jgi:hypothetical protein
MYLHICLQDIFLCEEQINIMTHAFFHSVVSCYVVTRYALQLRELLHELLECNICACMICT